MIQFKGIPIPADIKQSKVKEAAKFLRFDSKNEYTFGKINLMLYIDLFGDFFEKTGPMARICQAIYDSLSEDDQKHVMSYLMDKEMGEHE